MAVTGGIPFNLHAVPVNAILLYFCTAVITAHSIQHPNKSPIFYILLPINLHITAGVGSIHIQASVLGILGIWLILDKNRDRTSITQLNRFFTNRHHQQSSQIIRIIPVCFSGRCFLRFLFRLFLGFIHL